MNNIKVVIADDHKLFRRGMCALLEDFGFVEVIGEAGNGVELLELLKKAVVLPEIVLLDLHMPEMDGVEAFAQIRKLFPAIKVIIITMEDDEHFILHLIRDGVNGYLLKNAEPEEVEKTILKVSELGFCFSEDLSSFVMQNLKIIEKAETIVKPELTEREYQVLELICREKTTAEIAQKLNISVRTVDGHRLKITEKTGAKNVAGLIIMALKYKWVTK